MSFTEQVFQRIQAHGPVTDRDVAEALGVNIDAVRSARKRLQYSGRVVKCGERRQGAKPSRIFSEWTAATELPANDRAARNATDEDDDDHWPKRAIESTEEPDLDALRKRTPLEQAWY